MSTDPREADRWIIRHGSPEAPPVRLALRAGPVSLIFEDGDLRYLRVGTHEILRRVYVMVRDHEWHTYPARLRHLETDIGPDRFRVVYQAEHRGDPADGARLSYRSEVVCEGDASGAVRMVLRGVAEERFRSNRIGICVLHPAPACAGARVRIDRVDGGSELRVFPRWIAPREPFTDIAALTTWPLPGLTAQLRVEGAVFETEDQRNFGDASFKTFSTPLRLPRPVAIAPGTTHAQAVGLTLLGRAPDAAEPPAACQVRLGRKTTLTVPACGLGIGARDLAPAEAALVRLLAPAHLQAVIALGGQEWPAALAGSVALARQIGCALELAVLLPAAGAVGADGIEAVAAAVRRLPGPLPPLTWIVYARDGELPRDRMAAAAATLRPLQAGSRVGGGSWLSFTMLNVHRPQTDDLDVLAFASNPQGHAADSSTVMENLAAVHDAVASAQAFAATAGVAVAPLRFRPRVGEAAHHPRQERDPRLSALFGASWALGAFSQAAAAGALSVTIAEAVGEEGVLPESAPSGRQVHPLFHALADINALQALLRLETEVDQPLRLAALAAQAADGPRLLLANLRPEPTPVVVSGWSGPCRVRQLDEASAGAALSAPVRWRASAAVLAGAGASGDLALELPPYAMATLRGGAP